MLNQFGRFVPLNKSSFDMELDYSPNANDYFDESQLPKMNRGSARTAGWAGAIAAGSEFIHSAAVLRQIKLAIENLAPKAAGEYLFEVTILRNHLESSWFMLNSIQPVETHSPQSLAKRLYKCQSGKAQCVQSVPEDHNQYYKNIYVIVRT